MSTYNNLPLYILDIDDELNSDREVFAVAIVDRPAIKVGFQKFADAIPLKFVTDDARRIVTGPLLIPDSPTYRNDATGEYYVQFKSDVIERIAVKYFRQGYGNKVNLMHAEDDLLDGITLFESFITDPARGIAAPAGFEELPAGTWFVSYKVDNDRAWASIQRGAMTGFSIEGLFSHKQEDDGALEEALRGISPEEFAAAALAALEEI